MNTYYVTFAWGDGIFCTNIARAESAEAVELYYERKYDAVLNVREAQINCELQSFIDRGMPIVDIP